MDANTGAFGERQRSGNPTDGNISTAVANCLDLFRRLLSLEEWARDSDNQSIKFAIQDEETRFKVWSGNIGAHKTGRSSLQYRLRDASHLQKQVLRLLADLSELHEDAIAIVMGEKVPWEKLDEEPLRGDEEDGFSHDLPGTELGQISTDIVEVVNCLLRLSVSIRNPAPHDRFSASAKTDTRHYEPFDIQHVRSKFGDRISDGLAMRLGKAISSRRQYFRYRESHRAKLSHGLEGNVKDGDLESTVASSIPHHLKDSKTPESHAQIVDEDTRSETGMTETSFASSAPGTVRNRLPPLPAGAEKGPFECPFCFMMISATNHVSWRRHVYGDFRPYVCLSEDRQAPEQEFTRRRDWVQHELQHHWKFYTCPLGCDETASFRSAAALREHIETKHKTAIPTGSALDAMVDLQAQPLCIEESLACQLCGEALLSIQSYRRHVGRHQEQLSLFALPDLVQGEELEDGSSNSEASTGTEGHESLAADVVPEAPSLDSSNNNPMENLSHPWYTEFDSIRYLEKISSGIRGHVEPPRKIRVNCEIGFPTMIEEVMGVNKTGPSKLEGLGQTIETPTGFQQATARYQPQNDRGKLSAIEREGAEIAMDSTGKQERNPTREEGKKEAQKQGQHDISQADSTPEEPEPGWIEATQSSKSSSLDRPPPGAIWTKIDRKLVNPEALTIGKERFEVRDDFIIVLRVLSKEEIQAYADATEVLRSMSPSSDSLAGNGGHPLDNSQMIKGRQKIVTKILPRSDRRRAEDERDHLDSGVENSARRKHRKPKRKGQTRSLSDQQQSENSSTIFKLLTTSLQPCHRRLETKEAMENRDIIREERTK